MKAITTIPIDLASYVASSYLDNNALEEVQKHLDFLPWEVSSIEALLSDEHSMHEAIDAGQKDDKHLQLYRKVLEKV